MIDNKAVPMGFETIHSKVCIAFSHYIIKQSLWDLKPGNISGYSIVGSNNKAVPMGFET